MQTVLVLLLGILTLIAVSLQRTYSKLPLKELKRRARHQDPLAAAMLRASGYGYSLRAVLWFLIAVTSAGFFVAVTHAAPIWFAFAASVILVWLGFVWLPAARITALSERLAAASAPVLSKVVGFLHPLIDRAGRFINRHHPVHIHTGLYDRQDLIDLINQQLTQPDNRIEQTELTIALHALTFGDDTVGQHLTPRRVVKAVGVDEPLGPILMDELHKSGHSRFPVHGDHPDEIVGTLYLRDLVHTKAGGVVRKVMKPGVAYIHEEQSLHDALQAILRTHCHLFIVVNSFEEYVGIISIEDILETILGTPIIDEFDQYDDLRAVAARAAQKEHREHVKHKTETKPQEVEPKPPVEPVQTEEDDLTSTDTAEASKDNSDEVHDEKPVEEEPSSPPKRIVHREEDIDETIEL